MAELILTPEEEAAASWADLDDASLGKLVKAGIAIIEEGADENSLVQAISAGTLLVGKCHDTNATETTLDLKGVTVKGEPIGDWKIEITKVG